MERIGKRLWIMVLALVLAGIVPAAASAQDYDEDDDQGDACGLPAEPRLAGQYPAGIPIRGVAADPGIVFLVQPAAVAGVSGPGIHVMERRGGSFLHDLAGSWQVPLSLRTESFRITHERGHAASTDGTFLLFDAMIPPSMIGPGAPSPHLYRFHYAYNASTHGYTADLLVDATVPLAQFGPTPYGFGPNPFSGVLYVESFGILPDGRVMVGDAVIGAIWISDDPTLASWHLFLLDQRFGASPGGTIHGTGRASDGGTRAYAFLPPAPPGTPPGFGSYPGMSGLTYVARTDEVCWTVVGQGGIFCMPRAVLLDPSIPPFAKTLPMDPQHMYGSARVLLSPSAPDGNLIAAMDYNRFDPNSTLLYFQRAVADEVSGGYNVLRAVDVVTGAFTDVARSQTRYDWASEVNAAPPLCLDHYPLDGSGGHCFHAAYDVFSSVGQEEDNADTNVLLDGVSQYVGPTPVPFARIHWN